jgi:hypothetical protein
VRFFSFCATSGSLRKDFARSVTSLAEPITSSPLAARRVKAENGSGSGDYAPGTQLIVSANDPPKDQKFQPWVDHQILLLPIAPTTTAIIPYQEVIITATYSDLPKYMLTVVNGSNTGSYTEGTEVP